MDDETRQDPGQQDPGQPDGELTEQRQFDWRARAGGAVRHGYDSTEKGSVVPAAMSPDEAVAAAEPEPDHPE